MIHEPSVKAVDASQFTERFGKPLYDSYCFSRIPDTIYRMLTGEGEEGLPDSVFADIRKQYNKVILILIDGFGWRFYEQFRDAYAFLKRFGSAGVEVKLTTQFPSTTAAHITTIHGGMPPSKSGIYEWVFFDPTFDRVIAPLLFSYAGDKGRNTLASANLSPRKLFHKKTKTIYQRLKEKGIKSTVFQHIDYTPSPYSNVMFTGATVVPYKTHAEAIINLSDLVLSSKKKGYYFLYLDSIDMLAHKYGPGSRPMAAEIYSVVNLLEKFLHNPISQQAKKTLLLVTADHGQMEVSPQTTMYVNQLDPSITELLRTNQAGEPILFAGSPRDLFLYIKDECLDEAQNRLTNLFSGRADVFRTQDLIDQGLFGPLPASDLFMSRIGNLVILPYEKESVYWRETKRFEQIFYGHHGGLSRQEMETQLLMLPY